MFPKVQVRMINIELSSIEFRIARVSIESESSGGDLRESREREMLSDVRSYC